MLTKQVYVTRPPVRQHGFYNVNQTHIKKVSQEELIELIGANPWSVGSFITMAPGGLLDLFVIHAVVGMETSAENVHYNVYSGKPRPYKLLQLGPKGSTIRPWCRWGDLDGARFLTQEESEKFINPNRDYISGYIEQYKDLETSC